MSLKALKAREEEEEREKEEKLSRNQRLVKESTDFYNQTEPKPGSLAAKARMVQKYNEKHMKK